MFIFLWSSSVLDSYGASISYIFYGGGVCLYSYGASVCYILIEVC